MRRMIWVLARFRNRTRIDIIRALRIARIYVFGRDPIGLLSISISVLGYIGETKNRGEEGDRVTGN